MQDFLKVQYLLNELRYEAEFLSVIRNLYKQQIYVVNSTGCGQANLGMVAVMLNSELASSQE